MIKIKEINKLKHTKKHTKKNLNVKIDESIIIKLKRLSEVSGVSLTEIFENSFKLKDLNKLISEIEEFEKPKIEESKKVESEKPKIKTEESKKINIVEEDPKMKILRNIKRLVQMKKYSTEYNSKLIEIKNYKASKNVIIDIQDEILKAEKNNS